MVGMFRVGSVTVLATTLNVVGAVEEEEDEAPELFLPLRVAIRRVPTCRRVRHVACAMVYAWRPYRLPIGLQV